MNNGAHLEKLRSLLTESRYKHTLGVADTAKRMAEKYAFPAEKAYTAGLLHDCAKCISIEQMLQLCSQAQIETDDDEKTSVQLMHAPAGAAMAMLEFGITDTEIINAIRYHTISRKGMTLIDKIIYISDCIEPNRQIDGVDKLRQIAQEDIDEAMLACLDTNITYVLTKKKILHPNSIYARNEIIRVLRQKKEC